MLDRTPGQGRYAATEREQRWLLAQLPGTLTDPTEIVDTYLRASTLRLRRARRGDAVVYKLGQKVRPDPAQPSYNQITNIYLTATEFGLFERLEGVTVSKTRWRWSVGPNVLSVDEFGEVLRRLVLAEVELSSPEACPPPPLSVADVTDDSRFSGGALARLTPAQAQEFLEMVATMAAASGQSDAGAV